MFKNFMQNKHLVYAMKDNKQGEKPVLIKVSEAIDWNEKKYGIFFTVQGFKGNRRVTENLDQINAWAIDLDYGTKEEQKLRIRKAPIFPTCIVESKNGYHCYWKADGATVATFKEIQDRLVSFFGADKRAKDLCRILRVPAMYHWKDEDDPYLVKEIYSNANTYTPEKMLKKYPEVKKPPMKRLPQIQDEVDCLNGLRKLSGSLAVNGGGPLLVHWLKWYGYDYKGAKEYLEKL